MKKHLLKDSNQAVKSIEKKAGTKSLTIPKETIDKMEKAHNIAMERINFYNSVQIGVIEKSHNLILKK